MDHRPVRPDFDVNEEYLIACYRKGAGKKPLDHITPDVMFLAIAFALFTLGLGSSDLTWCLVGFGLVAYRMIQWIISNYQYQATSMKLIMKYEDAFRAPSEQETKRE
jgi:hypothetical protein